MELEIRSLRRIVEQHLAGFAWARKPRSAPAKERNPAAASGRRVFALSCPRRFGRSATGIRCLPGDGLGSWVLRRPKPGFTIGIEDDIVDRGGVYALVGPDGVGKTTTTAAGGPLRPAPRANKVALVTTDGYRIGAHEQLRIYGRILGVSVHLVKDAAELRQTLAELRHKHMVLIDTMGMSQKDKLVPELTGMLAGCQVQRLLLLSSTSRGDTLDDVVRAHEGEALSAAS